jgi:hypothetical protein
VARKRIRLLLKSARAPAGKVKRKKGNEAAVAMSDSSSSEAPDGVLGDSLTTTRFSLSPVTWTRFWL